MVNTRTKVNKARIFILVGTRELVSSLNLLYLAKLYRRLFNTELLNWFIYSKAKFI